ncbi:hypothetical protein [Leptospira andrefontaineae]|uniref:Uncharacterized protein n=1 Tax=Leptospira andrefontaineae TaxID=2484976 RepID=A0A4R9GXC0_9LEPT|nr:hypothetical protein [Leptospira andrefontaineae]TGK36284.1 hypothetical protein EHO65_18460 [Leptospira andrefontaineae]
MGNNNNAEGSESSGSDTKADATKLDPAKEKNNVPKKEIKYVQIDNTTGTVQEVEYLIEKEGFIFYFEPGLNVEVPEVLLNHPDVKKRLNNGDYLHRRTEAAKKEDPKK